MTSILPPGVNLPGVGRPAPRRDNKRDSATNDRSAYAPPARPHYTYIPPPSVMQDLVDRALGALSRGIYWDRGSIVNLLL